VANAVYDHHHYLQPSTIGALPDWDVSKILNGPVLDFIQEKMIPPDLVEQVAIL
jgi:hypothetical protein